jgi:prevent-host-death family protein
MLIKSTYRVSLKEIQRNFPAYLRRVREGQTLVITENGKPMAEMKPTASTEKKPRPYGLCAGEFRTPDDFNSPLPDDILKDFEGK